MNFEIMPEIKQEKLPEGLTGKLVDLVRLMRPLQWTKNGLVFLPLIFSNNILELPLVWQASVMFLAFSAAASGVYILNDLVDVDQDRLHSEKKNRPLASGGVRPQEALVLAVMLAVIALSLGGTMGPGAVGVVLGYLVLQAGYSLWWQQVAVLDVSCIAAGFVLRTVAGGVAIGVAISPWMLAVAFLWAFFIAVNKRKSELASLGSKASAHRAVLAGYAPELVSRLGKGSRWATTGAYALYTLSGRHSLWLVVTIPFVAGGMERYQYLVDKKGLGGSPERVVFQDPLLVLIILAWLAAAAGIIMLAY